MIFVCGQLQSIRGLGNRVMRDRVFLQELTIAKLVNKFSAYCAKRSYCRVYKSLPLAVLQSTLSHLVCLESTLILSYSLCNFM